MGVAATWGAAPARKMGLPMPDCSLCRQPMYQSIRESEWGCDAPASGVVFSTTCSACEGNGCPEPEDGAIPGEPRCIDGRRSYYRCPSAVIEESESGRDVKALIESVRDLDQWSVLPGPGGMLDQNHCFVDGLRIVMHERGVWDRQEREHDQVVSRQGGMGDEI